MSKSLDYFIERLPPFIGKEILKFLVIDSETIHFTGENHRRKCGYSLKYEVAYRFDKILQNLSGVYLARILKRNGKHRYYLTREKEYRYCKCCGEDDCGSQYCRGGGWYYEYEYDSKYVGKDMERALFELSVTKTSM